TPLAEAAAQRMKESGVSGVSIGLDSATPPIHDTVRGFPGAWAAAVAAAGRCRAQGIQVQINTVVTSANLGEIPALIEFAGEMGAKVFSPFFLVCTGRAEEMTDITPAQYEEILSYIAGLGGEQKRGEMMIRTRCAPTIRRILHARDTNSVLLQMDAGRCLAGRTYCRITPDGTVTACPYLPLPLGNVRAEEFERIWNASPVLESLRSGADALKGKCGACRYRLLCGGCRARAYAHKKDYLHEDPWCAYAPAPGEAVKEAVMPPSTAAINSTINSTIQGLAEPAGPAWSREAGERLNRVPFFVRSMVKAAVERYARERGCSEITPAIMEELKGRVRRPAMDGH
ncbi:MAG: SPASM domain-containing protein, partial [Nitrospiraceae bacterium]|nr:SPASM domain-containing protein [Nitrospiraceae bacterium]